MRPETFDQMLALFPNPEEGPADGPLAYGGDLSPQMLLAAYSRGIFPWYSEDLPILWHSPDPRAILPLASFHISPRSARKIRNTPFTITLDKAFGDVMRLCGNLREKGTWITAEMLQGYCRLHDLGYAHSIETWLDGQLVGGLYGISLGSVFCGESMFHTVPEASRAALRALVALLRQEDFRLLDIQQETPHMERMGAITVSRHEYLAMLRKALATSAKSGNSTICPWPAWRKILEYNRLENRWLPPEQTAL